MRPALLAAIAAAALVSVPAASPTSTEAIAHHCVQPIGEVWRDICYAVIRKTTTGTYSLILGMGDEYFPRYGLCVRPQGEKRTCRIFPVRQDGIYGPSWGGNVRWKGNFPLRGPRRYWVTWWEGGHRLGPALTFRSSPR